ncbi:hypothetical protein WJX74_002160 [Apatococcus lobatus]|uniref:Ubiquinol oxidase n=1 Tax=Apatococcus lobatus TaxID=904363 RepID=A0AAW1QK33_9CHLO
MPISLLLYRLDGDQTTPLAVALAVDSDLSKQQLARPLLNYTRSVANYKLVETASLVLDLAKPTRSQAMLRAAALAAGKSGTKPGYGLQLLRQTSTTWQLAPSAEGLNCAVSLHIHTGSGSDQKLPWISLPRSAGPSLGISYCNLHIVRGIGSPAAAQEPPRQEPQKEDEPKQASGQEQSSLSEAEAQHKAERELGGDVVHAGHPDDTGRHGDTTNMSALMTQPSYDMEYLESVRPKHKPPEGALEHLALYGVRTMRWCFDTVTRYNEDKMTEKQWLRRILFLEAIAGVPGMVGGMMRHMRSLRSMKRDNGWIHTLLEEAENERMHLLTFLELKQPSVWMRLSVLLAQGVFFNFYLLAYIISPRLCHTAVGYLEEEAVRTYTHAIRDIDEGRNPEWADKEAPEIAVEYWQLGAGAKMRHLLLAVRADEASHNHVNHVFASMDFREGANPFAKNAHIMP